MTRKEYCSQCDVESMEECMKRDCPLFVDQPKKSAEQIFTEYNEVRLNNSILFKKVRNE